MSVIVNGGKALVIRERKSSPFADARPQTVRAGTAVNFPVLGLSSSYADIYRSQPWIYAVVNKLARGLARLPTKAYVEEAGTKDYLSPRDQPAHPLPVLLSRPFPRGSRFKLIEATVGSLGIYGNAGWWKFREGPGRAPVELWPLDWRYMSHKVGGPIGVEHYEYNGPAGRKIFLPDDVVHFQWWSPAGPQGTSPLEPLRTTLALEDAGRRYAVASFANGARPSGAITTPKALNPAQKAELRSELQGYGGPDAAFRIALMDGGMDWKPFSHTAQEAQTIEHRKLNREEACGVYDLPPPALQILDRATFSNVTEQNKALYRESLGPWAALLEETIEAQLLWGEPDYAGTYVELDFDAVLQADLPTRAAAYRSLETTMSANERRRLENRPALGDPADPANPANGVSLPLNMALILPNGSVFVPSAGDSSTVDPGAAIENAIRNAVEAALAERELASP